MRAEWQVTYDHAPEAYINSDNMVYFDTITGIAPYSSAYQTASQTVTATAVWVGPGTPAPFVKIAEFASASGGGSSYVTTNPDPGGGPITLAMRTPPLSLPRSPWSHGERGSTPSTHTPRFSNLHRSAVDFSWGDGHNRTLSPLDTSAMTGGAWSAAALTTVGAVNSGYWTFDFCVGLSMIEIDNGRGDEAVGAWFSNYDTYRMSEKTHYTVYPVKRRGGRFVVNVKPCTLRAEVMNVGGSPYQTGLYAYTVYQVRAEEVDIKVILDTPKEESVFRGRPVVSARDENAVSVQAFPCPILIKGRVVLPPNLDDISDLKIEFTREKTDAEGKTLVTNDRGDVLATNSPDRREYKEAKIADKQFVGGVDGVTLEKDPNDSKQYRFRVVWNQRLSRTLTQKYNRKDVDEKVLEKGPHYWQIRAKATFSQVVIPESTENNTLTPAETTSAEVKSDPTRVRIFAMAFPRNGSTNDESKDDPIIWGGTDGAGDYHEVNRAAKTAIELLTIAATGEEGEESVLIPVNYLLGGPDRAGGSHLAVDYFAPAGATERATEVGEISLKTLPPIDIRSSVVSKDAEKILARMTELRDTESYPQGEDVNNLFSCYFYRLPEGASFNNDHILGPQVILQHSGGKAKEVGPLINISLLPDGTYEEARVQSVYCHVKATADGVPVLIPEGASAGKLVEISDPLCTAGDAGNSNEVFRLGYFTATGAIIGIYEKNKPVIDKYLVGTVTIGSLHLPSSTGSHLHFEVRVEGRVDKNRRKNNKLGEQNPHHWVKSIKPGERIEPSSTRNPGQEEEQ